MTTVLVVDDEPIVREVVVRYLDREGYRTLEAGDGDDARRLLEHESPSLVVLDLMLPGTDGLALCRWIRGRSDLPVIMLTARGEEADRIVGLELGADDYVTKPFSPRELVARVKTVLRRADAATAGGDERSTIGDLEIDAGDARGAQGGGEPAEADGAGVRPALVPRQPPAPGLLARPADGRVWGYTAALDTGTVTVHIRRLREKIEDDPSRPGTSRPSGASATGSPVIELAILARRRRRSPSGSSLAFALRLLPTRAAPARRARAARRRAPARRRARLRAG